ncbi:MAG: FAD-binding oxidoreductase [Acidobacteriota bacterium]|nr:FAD-binding oxidoreductase [Acidobacteriota bacterium]
MEQVVTPTNLEELSSLLRTCNQQQRAVEILGAGTRRHWGNPVAATLGIQTTGLSGVQEHSWQDLTATVAAGTPWSTMQQALAQHGQCVALDPLFATRSTVGGVVATNDSGALRLRYGSLRDLIIGITLVLADGTVARSGGKVVKNVAGYDLQKLMTGAYGTLGVIAAVNFRLHPLPRSVASWTVGATEIAPLDALRHALADSTLVMEALQLRTTSSGFALDVQFGALASTLQDHAERLHFLARPLQPVPAAAEVWQLREQLFAPEQATAKVTCQPAQLAALLPLIANSGGTAVAQQTGTLLAALSAQPGLVTQLRQRAEQLGGALQLLAWPAEVAEAPPRWSEPRGAIALMREIKRQFDPQSILNPGRFVGGI